VPASSIVTTQPLWSSTLMAVSLFPLTL
jgi:hypothetical protein